MNKKQLIKMIHKEFPQLKFSQTKCITCGFDHVVLMLDNRYIFRFPKENNYKRKIRTEMKFLNELIKNAPVSVPHYKFIAKDFSFGGYEIIRGEMLKKSRFKELNNKQKDIIAQKLGDFLTALHSFSIIKAKKFGLKAEWSLKEEKKEYEKRKKFVFSVLSKSEKEFVQQFVKKYFEMKVPKRACVIHHDLSGDHIFISNRGINGIIDFGDTSLGDPAKDFSWLWELGNVFVNNVYEHYGGLKDKTFLQRSKNYYFAGLLSRIYHGVADKKKLLLKTSLSIIRKVMNEEEKTGNMRKIVEEGYEKGDYTAHFRKSKKPNKMEKNFLDKLIKLIPKKATVLDFGCGTGIPIDKYLVEKKHQVTGIDISQKHISLARHNVPRGKFLKADFSRFNFGKEKFDIIVSFYAIFHLPREEHKALFLKMRKLLKKNGVILITLGTSGSEYGEEENWVGAKMAWSTYSPRIYKKMIKECGFTIVESEFEGKPGDEEYHFWLLAQKTHQMPKKTL